MNDTDVTDDDKEKHLETNVEYKSTLRENNEDELISSIKENKKKRNFCENETENNTSIIGINKANDNILLKKILSKQNTIRGRCKFYLKEFRSRKLMKKQIKNKKNYKNAENKKRENKELMEQVKKGCEHDRKTKIMHSIRKNIIEEENENGQERSIEKKIKEKTMIKELNYELIEKKMEPDNIQNNEEAKNKDIAQKNEDNEESIQEYMPKNIQIDEKNDKEKYMKKMEQRNKEKQERNTTKKVRMICKNTPSESEAKKVHEQTHKEPIPVDMLYLKHLDESIEGKNEINQDKKRITREISIFEKTKEFDNERLRYIFEILNVGIKKIEAIKAMCRDYKENFNKSMKEKIDKINSLMFFSSDNNFKNNFTVEYLENHDKLNSIKEERIGRLFLYIEDINKIKQALEMQWKEKNNTDAIENNSEKNESFYDANENIEDFFIFDDTLSYLNNEDVDSVLANTEYNTVSFLQEDDRLNDFLGELKKEQVERLDDGIENTNQKSNINNISGKKYEKQNNESETNENNRYSAFNRFPKFSFKNYYCFDLNKNLCYIYSYTPSILKKLAEKFNAYNSVKTNDAECNAKPTDTPDQDNVNCNAECSNKSMFHYYPRYAVDGGNNLNTYIQFHCEKWQENLYDTVEVKSFDVEFNLDCLKCNIMELF